MLDRISVQQKAAGHSMLVRLAAALTIILAIAASGALNLAWLYGRCAVDDAYDQILKGAALQIAERVTVSDGNIMVDIPASAFELLALAHDDRIFYRIIGPHGSTLTGAEDLPLPAKENRDAATFYDAVYSNEAVRLLELGHALTEREVSGRLRIIVAQTVRLREALARDLATKAAMLIGGATLVIMLLALVAARAAFAPLAKVETALLRRDPNDLSPLTVAAPRELSTVVGAINHFINRLARRMAMVESFVADTAHQLRTPIAAIHAQAELAQSAPRASDLRQINQRILDRSVAVGRLADQLLNRALISHRGDSVMRARLDLRMVAIEADNETYSLSPGGDPPLLLDLPEDEVMVMGDRFSLREAAKNLINNAKLHGAPPFSLIVRRTGDEAELALRDSGTGIPPDIRVAVGERFHKTSDAEHGGSGLGLAIVSDVAVQHGGNLHYRDLAHGFEIAMALPLAGERR